MPNAQIFQSYDWGFTAGSVNREDLSDIIVNIAPFETPLFSTAPRTPIRHTTHEWLEDSLTAASALPYSAAYGVEGADFSGVDVSIPARTQNWTQIFRKDFKVSETQRVLNPAGMRDVYQYQIEIAMKEIARHIETKLFDPTAGSATGTSSTIRQMKPIATFVTANTASGSASAASLGHAKTVIDTLIEKCFIAGGSPSRIYCHPNSKTQFANALGGSAGVNYRNIAATDARVVGNIDVYTSNFNVVELVPDRFVPSGSATGATTGLSGASGGRWWLLDQPRVKIGVLRPLKHVPLPPAGDSVRGMVLTELTLVVEAPGAHGQAWNIITSA